jgi:DNA polymerase III alpha subunit
LFNTLSYGIIKEHLFHIPKGKLSMVKFINLHAHSELSILDGVGDVKKHFKKTLESGHCGCCITDHGSYASAFYLDTIYKNQTKDKDIKLTNGLHKVVRGSEIYIYYDIDQKEVLRLLMENDSEGLIAYLHEISTSFRYTALFCKPKVLISNSSDEILEQDLMGNKSVKEKIGNDLIGALEEFGINEETTKMTHALALKMVRCNSNKYGHITLLAQNLKGHHNLCKIVSESHLPENFYTRPRFPLSKLLERSEGLLATTGCFIGIIPTAIFKQSGKEKELLQYFLSIFGERFFIEIHLADVSYKFDNGTHYQYTDINPQRVINDRMIELSKEFGMTDRIYIAQDSHMPNKEDKIIQDLIIKSDEHNKNGWHFKDAYFIKTVEEMWVDFKKIMGSEDREFFEKLCNNTMNALDLIEDFKIPVQEHLAEFDYTKHWANNPRVPKTTSNDLNSIISLYKQDFTEINEEETAKNVLLIKESEELIQKLIELPELKNDYYSQKVIKEIPRSFAIMTMFKTIARNKKIDLLNPVYARRLMFEIDTIVLNGFCDFQNYFMTIEMFSRVLILSDELRGPGRGSAAGSLLAFVLDITDIDPIVENLLFGRFLSKERVGGFDCQFVGAVKDLNSYTKEQSVHIDLLTMQ